MGWQIGPYRRAPTCGEIVLQCRVNYLIPHCVESSRAEINVTISASEKDGKESPGLVQAHRKSFTTYSKRWVCGPVNWA